MTMSSHKQIVAPAVWNANSWRGLDAYSRHVKLVQDYQKYYQKAGESLGGQEADGKTDKDVLRENWRFIRTTEDDADSTWEKRMARTYYDRLFKEYCLADLKHYKDGRMALRWRMEKEVLDGKGQFICGNVRCEGRTGLRSWEVNFGYVESGEKKNALVKLRLCTPCSVKLNYRKQMREAIAARKRSRPDATPSDQGDSPLVKFPKGDTPSDLGNDDSRSSSSTAPSPQRSPQTRSASAADETALWSRPAATTGQLEKSRDEEYDEYFQDLML